MKSEMSIDMVRNYMQQECSKDRQKYNKLIQ